MKATEAHLHAASVILNKLVEAVQEGEFTVDGPAATALVRRLQGAAAAMEIVVRDEA